MPSHTDRPPARLPVIYYFPDRCASFILCTANSQFSIKYAAVLLLLLFLHPHTATVTQWNSNGICSIRCAVPFQRPLCEISSKDLLNISCIMYPQWRVGAAVCLYTTSPDGIIGKTGNDKFIRCEWKVVFQATSQPASKSTLLICEGAAHCHARSDRH